MTQPTEFVIRNAYVLTMDAALGDLPDADVHVRNGAIAAVGRAPQAPGAERIDGAGMIVLPGLVETHWHIWGTLLRSLSGDRPEHGYFPTSRTVGTFYTAKDMYAAARLAAAEAVNSGITFVHDWCHNVRGPEFAEATCARSREAGIRARFSYGSPTGASNDAPDRPRRPRAPAESLGGSYSNGGLLTLGLAWRGAASEASLRDPTRAPRARPADIRAREQLQDERGRHRGARASELLDSRTQVIHAIWCTPEEIRALADSGSSVSVSPTRSCGSGSACRSSRIFAPRASRWACPSTRPRCRATRTCSRS